LQESSVMNSGKLRAERGGGRFATGSGRPRRTLISVRKGEGRGGEDPTVTVRNQGLVVLNDKPLIGMEKKGHKTE